MYSMSPVGAGGTARWPGTQGYGVTGIDRDVSAHGCADDEGVTLIEVDLEGEGSWPLATRRFDGVIVANYLHRPILPHIVAAVADDGVLIYETFAVGQALVGRPRRPEFLLQPGELLAAVRGTLTVLAFEHGRLADPDRFVQRIAAVGPRHRWVTNPGALPAR